MLDGLVRQVGGEVVVGIAHERENLGVIAEQVGGPLVGLAAHEPVEILEAQARGPLVIGPGDAVLIGRGVVVLAEPGRGIAVLLEDRANAGALQADDGVVAGIARGQFADHAGTHRVMVAAGDQRRPGGRAQGSRVELGVTQSCLGDPIESRRGDDTAKGARDAVALVVGHDQQHVGRALRRHHAGRPVGLGVRGAFLDDTAKFHRRRRKLLAVYHHRGTGRARRAVDLLGSNGCGSQRGQRNPS